MEDDSMQDALKLLVGPRPTAMLLNGVCSDQIGPYLIQITWIRNASVKPACQVDVVCGQHKHCQLC
jgi:hypothetical protein